jgi:hypothetical protein
MDTEEQARDLATAIVEDLLHTSPFYIMEDARKNWITIVDRHLRRSVEPLQNNTLGERGNE